MLSKYIYLPFVLANIAYFYHALSYLHYYESLELNYVMLPFSIAGLLGIMYSWCQHGKQVLADTIRNI